MLIALLKGWRRGKAAELPLDETGKGDRRAVVEMDRQGVVVREGDGRHRRGKNDVNILEQRLPACPQAAADPAGTE